MQIIQTVLALVFTLGILVTLHEYGHFWVARRFGVKVLRFRSVLVSHYFHGMTVTALNLRSRLSPWVVM